MVRISIESCGAVGDGRTLNTAAIQRAVDACAAQGGGVVVIPRGCFVAGTVQLRSHVWMYWSRGAVLKGSGRLEDYRDNGFFHPELGETTSLLYAIGETDIRLYGEGVIDFSGREFFPPDTPPEQDGARMAPTEAQRAEAVQQKRPRPTQPLFFHRCTQVTVEDLKLTDSPCWTLTCSCCRRVRVCGIEVDNSLVIPNCDGVHLSSCREAEVVGCAFSCGDDCVAVTGITDPQEESENIVIRQCRMRSRSAGVRIGHLNARIRGVTVEDLVMVDSNRGLALFAGDGGRVEQVTCRRIRMQTRIIAGAWWGKGEAAVICAYGSGHIGAVTLEAVEAVSEAGFLVYGAGVRGLTLSDCRVTVRPTENTEAYGGLIDCRPAFLAEQAWPEGQAVLCLEGPEVTVRAVKAESAE